MPRHATWTWTTTCSLLTGCSLLAGSSLRAGCPTTPTTADAAVTPRPDASGSAEWSPVTDEGVWMDLATDGTRIYAAGYDAEGLMGGALRRTIVIAAYELDGTLAWRHELGDGMNTGIANAVEVGDGPVTAGAEDQSIFVASYARTGTHRWSHVYTLTDGNGIDVEELDAAPGGRVVLVGDLDEVVEVTPRSSSARSRTASRWAAPSSSPSARA